MKIFFDMRYKDEEAEFILSNRDYLHDALDKFINETLQEEKLLNI